MSKHLKSIKRLPLLFFVIFAGCVNNHVSFDNGEVMRVNGHSVSQEEFCWFRQQQRAAVLSTIKATYDVEPGKNIWYQDLNGITPREIIHEKTTQKLTREKVEQGLFKELGLIEDIRFATFLANLEKMNQQRKRAVEQGKVIYGPIHYRPLQYYGHWMARTRIRAKDKLRKEQFDLAESKLRDYYSRNQNGFKTAELFTIKTLTISGKNNDGLKIRKDQLESFADEVFLKVQHGKALELTSQEYRDNRDFAVKFETFDEIHKDRLDELFPDSTIFNKTQSMTPGQVVRLADPGKEIWIVKCISVNPSHVVPYEEKRDLLVRRYVDEEYDRLIESRIKNAQVEINQKAIDGIEMF